MKTTLLSGLAFGACASVALAEPLPPAAGANDGAMAEALDAGPVTLTEAEMDKITGGAVDMFMKIGDIKGESVDGRPAQNVQAWSWKPYRLQK